MIYGITWLIKCCLKLKLLCKLSVPFGNSPSQDKNKRTEDGILQSLGEINRLINLRLGLVFFVFRSALNAMNAQNRFIAC